MIIDFNISYSNSYECYNCDQYHYHCDLKKYWSHYYVSCSWGYLLGVILILKLVLVQL